MSRLEWGSKRPLSWQFGNNSHRRGRVLSHKQISGQIERAWGKELLLEEMQAYYEELEEAREDELYGSY